MTTIHDLKEYFRDTDEIEPSYSWLGYFLIFAVGTMVTLLLAFSFRAGLLMSTTSVPLDDAAMEIKQELTTAHLWFEEILSGDRHMDMDEVWIHINKADWYAESMLNGGIGPAGKIDPLKDPELRKQVEAIRREITLFKEITTERYLAKPTSGAGTDIDERFDLIFNDLVEASDLIETQLHQDITQSWQRYRLIQMLFLAISLVLTLLAIFTFFYFEHRKKRDFIIIQIANERLRRDMIERIKAEGVLKKESHLAAVGQVASGVAHEINNPLATISACTEVLRNNLPKIADRKNEQYRLFEEYFALIEEETKRSANIVQELLDLSQHKEIEPEQCDPHSFIGSILKSYSTQDNYSKYTFLSKKLGNIKSIFADSNKLHQALIILLSNAIDAMPDGGTVTVTVDFDSESDHVLISVSDEGMGILQVDQERVFEPFFTTKIEKRGTGLGLTIMENIMREHGGKVTFETEPNKGSTFTLWFPFMGSSREI